VALQNWESDLQSNFKNMTQKDKKYDDYLFYLNLYENICLYTGWRTKCHTIDCAHNTFLLLQKHLTPGTE